MSHTIQNGRLNNTTIKRLSKHFKWSSFSIGQTKTNVTPSGGIHYTGKEMKTTSVSMEIKRRGMYYTFNIFSYPKGVIVHPFVPFPVEHSKISVSDIDQIVEEIRVIVVGGENGKSNH